ncbi:NAD(P)/FAD-dependent oxidoreductase [Shewanella sp. NIFS-20-20]|uniref:NAD(P)/FAD-dependent oxidoreductase n=1 Tax=Shewanella sp. NIFS-20-20 TaxID=2853806 RepID=UPI001C48047E|nr:FAD-dependent oxidoreductase [Shewanella sp. NIFS-20-20]MBV7314510.1 FAD-dependent oxidoreductase [Shewanella sp. NIFS-20-20]
MKKIAIVGSGISGLTAAHLLSERFDVTVFEANDYIGGHTATIDVELGGKAYAIDTGFIVFNDRTYPNFEKLLARIEVKPKPTEMSFSVQNLATGLEFNGHTLMTMFAQKSNLLKPQYWHFLSEIVRFNRLCKQYYQQDHFPSSKLGDFLVLEGFSDFFCQHYILPMGAAIWSTSLEDMRAFSLRFFVRFFQHHGLLDLTHRPQWYVLEGGSRSYIPGLIAPLSGKIRLNTPVTAITRHPNGVELVTGANDICHFDDVILACHSDQALAMLQDASDSEKDILGQMHYRNNEVVLHTDTSLLPARRGAWASWNYRLDGDNSRPSAVTYNMKILQGLADDAPVFCVSLNQTSAINPSKILRRFNYSHPVFDERSLAAAGRKAEICGQRHTYFAGAYWLNGFHEDGVNSALDVCRQFGVTL